MANDFKSGASQSSASGHGTVQTAMGRDAGAESGFDSKTSGDTSAAGMGMTQGRPTRINDALQVLDDALASQNSMGLKQIVTDEFQNLKHAISELAPKVSGQIKTAGSQVYDRASELASSGLEQGRMTAGRIDGNVRQNPWPVIGGIAVATFAFGFMLGRSGQD